MDKKRKELMRGTLEEIVKGLNSSTSPDELVRSSRKLKNELIGNLEKKRAFLDAGYLHLILGMINGKIAALAKQNLIHVVGSIALGECFSLLLYTLLMIFLYSEDALPIDDRSSRTAALTLVTIISSPDSISEGKNLGASAVGLRRRFRSAPSRNKGSHQPS
jgi:hypothetical protein